MYVEDMDLDDARETLRDLLRDQGEYLRRGRDIPEQLVWDIEDVEGRIEDLELAHDATDW